VRPQKQLFRHRPSEGLFGDCHRTAIACALDMDAKDVPHFMDGTPGKGEADRAHDLAEQWLNDRGLCTISILFPGTCSVQEIIESVANVNARSRPVFILGGESKSGVNHSVVCCDGRIVCDPGQDDPGIVGPCDDGWYWLTFFGDLRAAHAINRPKEVAA